MYPREREHWWLTLATVSSFGRGDSCLRLCIVLWNRGLMRRGTRGTRCEYTKVQAHIDNCSGTVRHDMLTPSPKPNQLVRQYRAYFHHPSPNSSLSPLSPSLLPPELVERFPPLEEWREKCLRKGIPEEALPKEDGSEIQAMTGGEYLKKRLKGSGL